MLDAGLDMQPTLNFLPLTLVSSPHFSQLRDWSPRAPSGDPLLENVSILFSAQHLSIITITVRKAGAKRVRRSCFCGLSA